jgi:hypothetical protein
MSANQLYFAQDIFKQLEGSENFIKKNINDGSKICNEVYNVFQNLEDKLNKKIKDALLPTNLISAMGNESKQVKFDFDYQFSHISLKNETFEVIIKASDLSKVIKIIDNTLDIDLISHNKNCVVAGISAINHDCAVEKIDSVKNEYIKDSAIALGDE